MDLQKELERLVNLYNEAIKQKAEASEISLKSLGAIEVLQKIIKEDEVKDESKVKKVSNK
tara:strand:+ start:3235 stop:3414 length:180 start_codon:yes stop_codon:yes gene_type:complete